jgi:hypothetical protein
VLKFQTQLRCDVETHAGQAKKALSLPQLDDIQYGLMRAREESARYSTLALP